MKALTAVLTLLFLTGCATTVGNDFSDEQVDQIVIGETSKSEVIQILGEPAMRGDSTYAENANVEGYDSYFSFVFSESQMSAQSFIPFVNLFFGSADTSTKTLTIHFDSDDIVANTSTSQGSQTIGTGLMN